MSDQRETVTVTTRGGGYYEARAEALKQAGYEVVGAGVRAKDLARIVRVHTAGDVRRFRIIRRSRS